MHEAPLIPSGYIFYEMDPQSEKKTVVTNEDFDGRLLKNTSWQNLKFFTGTLGYHQPFRG